MAHRNSDERQFRSSSHREKVVEHVFLGELLRFLWVNHLDGVQVLKPEVDAAGYDLVLSLGKVIRHLQLKSSMHHGKAAHQPIHDSLGLHPSGCVVWIVLKDDLSFERFLWFGGEPGQPLPDLAQFPHATHTRGRDITGNRLVREHVWKVPKHEFTPIEGMEGLVSVLFGVHPAVLAGVASDRRRE